MTVSYDPTSGMFMLKQSPWALLLFIGVILIRRIVFPRDPIAPGAGSHLAPRAFWVIDGLIGFGLGTVTALNTALWRRARAARAASIAGTFA